jgi:DNA recombination protein RmuC
MMITIILILLLVQLAVSVVLFWLLRRAQAGEGLRQLQLEMQTRERTQLDALERLRGGLEEAIARSGKLNSDALRETTAQLVEQSRVTQTELQKGLTDGFIGAQERIATALAEARKAQDARLDLVDSTLKSFSEGAARSSLEQREALAQTLNGLRDRLSASLQELRVENTAQLDKIRGTVEEKLQTALETRLTESFKVVSTQLEQVARGLGEMQQLATGVGDLKRVLTNVRTRGTFGEVQLGALLEQVLTRQQYAENIATVPDCTERVEYAIKLPGRDGDGTSVWLPIDAKFPQEDYLRLQQAYEDANVEAVELARKGLATRILGEAQRIVSKYVCPPHTTDFALMFLPTEGLYAEVLRIPGLAEDLQSKYRVVVTGPTNLYALLNSLQLGFRTLAIEQRSSEVWKILASVKTEFAKFGDSIKAVGKKLQEATNKIGEVETRSRAVQRQLRQVEALPDTTGTPDLFQHVLPESDDLN